MEKILTLNLTPTEIGTLLNALHDYNPFENTPDMVIPEEVAAEARSLESVITKANKALESHSRLFRATWGAGYLVPKTELHGLEWFGVANGYEADAIRWLRMLEVGEIHDFSDLSGQHSVERVQ